MLYVVRGYESHQDGKQLSSKSWRASPM